MRKKDILLVVFFLALVTGGVFVIVTTLTKDFVAAINREQTTYFTELDTFVKN